MWNRVWWLEQQRVEVRLEGQEESWSLKAIEWVLVRTVGFIVSALGRHWRVLAGEPQHCVYI